MYPDYYKILDASRDASPNAIKRAYRQRAMKCHPDRGGTHAQMLEIGEAFEVLSDPIRRKEYDYASTHPADSAAQQRSSTESKNARAHAQNYPREWSEFESWLNNVSRDVMDIFKFVHTVIALCIIVGMVIFVIIIYQESFGR